MMSLRILLNSILYSVAGLILVAATPAAATNQVRLGTGVSLNVWGERDDFAVPSVSAGLALVHAATLLQEAGLGEQYDANAIFATAIKESRLGMAYGDGPFQIESGTAFTEMQRIFPKVFGDLQHAEIIANDAFATSAITKAYYDVFAVAMLDEFGYRAHQFIAQAQDPQAAIKIVSLAYNRGLWWEQFPVLFQTDRARCVQADDLLDCINHDVADDHATAIAHYTRRLQRPRRYGGQFYDPAIRWSAVHDYLNTIAPFIPAADRTSVRAAARAAFNQRRNAAGKISFRDDAQAVIDAIIAASRRIPDPTKQIRLWY